MKKLNNRGLTLVEILAVVTILGIISTGAVAAYSTYLDKARQQDYKTMEESTYAAAQNYMMDYGVFGAGEEMTLDIVDDLVNFNYLDPLHDPTSKENEVCDGTVTIKNEGNAGAGEIDNLKYTVKVKCKGYNGNVTYP